MKFKNLQFPLKILYFKKVSYHLKADNDFQKG
jgi:hypothetical protein